MHGTWAVGRSLHATGMADIMRIPRTTFPAPTGDTAQMADIRHHARHRVDSIPALTAGMARGDAADGSVNA